jgi:glycerophosphoryl diester phosphodiesterase
MEVRMKFCRNTLWMGLTVLGCASSINNSPLLGTVDLQGHRGARGLRPENTLAAFEECFTHSMTTIELDTTLTKDDQLIVHHDSSTNPSLCQTKTGEQIEKKRIRSMTVAELKELDCGSKANPRFGDQKLVPGEPLVTLFEFFEFIEKHRVAHPEAKAVRFNIEIKVDEHFTEQELKLAAKTMVDTLTAAHMVSRTTVQSFRLEVLPMVTRLNPQLVTSALFEPSYWQGLMLSLGLSANSEEILNKTKALGAKVVSPYHMYVTPVFISQAHALKLQVIPWTVNDEPLMQRLLEMGVDGLISDYPDRLRKVYEASASK